MIFSDEQVIAYCACRHKQYVASNTSRQTYDCSFVSRSAASERGVAKKINMKPKIGHHIAKVNLMDILNPYKLVITDNY